MNLAEDSANNLKIPLKIFLSSALERMNLRYKIFLNPTLSLV